MKLVATVVMVLAAATPGLAHAAERPLVDGWVVDLPAEAPLTEDEKGNTSARQVIDQGQGRSALLYVGYSRDTGLLPRTKAQAAELLERKVQELIAIIRRDGAEVRDAGTERCDRGDLVGLESRLVVSGRNGELRIRTRLFYEGCRFVMVQYAAPPGHYSPRHAQAFLDSLRNPEREARAVAVGDRKR